MFLFGSHTFLVVKWRYVSEATHAFLGMLPFWFSIYRILCVLQGNCTLWRIGYCHTFTTISWLDWEQSGYCWLEMRNSCCLRPYLRTIDENFNGRLEKNFDPCVLMHTFQMFSTVTMSSFLWTEGAAVIKWLSSWLAEQEVRGSIPGLATWISEIGYLLLPSVDMAEIPLKRRNSSIQPTNQLMNRKLAHIENKEWFTR